MSVDTKGLIQRYFEWLREESSEHELPSGWVALTLPYLDHRNDFLRVFVSRESVGLRITDEGKTIRELRQAGCDLKAPTRRRAIAERILRNLDVDDEALITGELTAVAVNGEFPEKLHNLVLAMLAFDGLTYTAPSTVMAVFRDDVETWLSTIGSQFESHVKYPGLSGEDHNFDFVVHPRLGGSPKVLQSFPKPDRMHIQSFTYEVIDTRNALNGSSPEFYAVLNDETAPNKKQYRALLANDITPITWSHREEHILKFA